MKTLKKGKIFFNKCKKQQLKLATEAFKTKP